MKFSEKLQALRKEKGLSQEGFAEMLNVSRQAVSKWESGASYPEIEKIIAISEIFAVTVDSLIKDRELDGDSSNTTSEPYWASWRSHYEYKSKGSMFGLPLIHVNIGRGMKKAKGIIAVGNISTGVISVGLFSFGVFSFGVLGLGLISISALAAGALFSAGAVSVGVFSIGAVSFGVFTLGAFSMGIFSLGACSVASHIAIGKYATAHIAIGEIAKGVRTIVDTSPRNNFEFISATEVRQLINEEYPHLWGWITSLVTSIFRNI